MTNSPCDDRKGPLETYTRYQADPVCGAWTTCKRLKAFAACLWSPVKPLYSKLSPHHDWIRLLQIHPGKPGREIRTSLKIARLDHDLPPYEALSYEWKLRLGLETITCNGVTKLVPKNLFEALERLRHPKRIRVIWVDNVCINQADEEEKNQQVRQMDKVYRRASRVIVWLGIDGHNEAHQAFSTICTFVNAQENQDAPVAFCTSGKLRSYVIECIHSPPDHDSDDWIKVMALFYNTWFTRMWVLQEIVLARDAVITWGGAELDWQVLGRAIQHIRNRSYLHNRMEGRGFQNAHIMYALGKIQQSEQKTTQPFLHLLDLSRSFDVTEPKDKIFGLLGFSAVGVTPGLPSPWLDPPAYASSVEDIYTSIANQILDQEQSLDVLSYTSHCEADSPNNPRLPSWVADWNTKTIIYPLQGFHENYKHQAGKFKKMTMLTSQNLNILRLGGIMVDEVIDSTPRICRTDLSVSTLALRDLLEWCTKQGLYPSTMAITLTAGRNRQGGLLLNKEEHIGNLCAFLLQLDPCWLENTWPAEAPTLRKLMNDHGNADISKEGLWRFCTHRSAFMTKSGKLGLGPGAVRKGDLLVVLWGGQVPYILRRGAEGEGWYQFIGECYVDGVMNGEVAEHLADGKGYVEDVFELR